MCNSINVDLETWSYILNIIYKKEHNEVQGVVKQQGIYQSKYYWKAKPQKKKVALTKATFFLI